MKKLSILLLSLLLAAGTAACGGNHTNTASGAASSAESGAASKASAAKETSSAPQSSADERPVINVITEPLAEETDAAPGTSDTPDAADRTYTITFAGDILMDPGYSAGAALTQRGAEGSFDEEALALMRGADLFVVNNEFAWTAGGTAVSKEYNFRADPKHVHILTDMGADLVTLGNNHTYDYGEEGLLDTLNTLDQEGIPYIGAGKTQADAERAMILTIGDFRISILNAEIILFNANPPAQTAVGDKPGTFDSYRPELLYDAVRRAKAESDYCIVVTHWGSEGKSTPNEKQLSVAKGAADAGADLIIGGHPHVLQGISHLGKVPVCYSLGNFVFDQRPPQTRRGMMLRLRFRPRTLVAFDTIPVEVRQCRPCP